MIFPTIALWGNAGPDDAIGQIDRALNDRNHRLMAGLSLDRRFDSIRGALVVSQGNGKYLRLRHVVEASQEIPAAVREGLREATGVEQEPQHRNGLSGQGVVAPLLSDLCETQAAVIEKLKCEAGKYVDRVLAVAVSDPGLWARDFDGRESYRPLCDATRLAELSGVTVIDALPARDLAVGGTGRRLEAIPYWLMFADRDQRVASQTRSLLTLGEQSQLYCLPPSDGLDADVPNIRVSKSIGFGFLDALTRKHFPVNEKLNCLDRLYADGRQVVDLRCRWDQVLQETVDESKLNSQSTIEFEAKVTQRLVEHAEEYLQNHHDGFSNVIRTSISWVLDLLLNQFEADFGVPVQFNELFVSCAPQYQASVVNELTQRLPDCTIASTSKLGYGFGHLEPLVAAVHGLLHIDQMPGNVPWLTGADSQRILGRLTPGRPSNWRQLLRVMADFHPAPMKLRDAV